MVELGVGAGKRRDPRIPWVYVGSTIRSPEQRFDQHVRGYKSGRLVKRFGLRLRPDLYDDLEPVRTTRDAVELERGRAMSLAKAGFVAHMDGTSYGEGSGDWKEWGYRRVMRVSEHLDAAIAQLSDCSFAALDPETCADLLWGKRSFRIAEYIDQEDPPPAYGMFSHVEWDALRRRSSTILGRT